MVHPAGVYRFGNFELDLAAGEVRKFGLKIKLQEKPLQLLTLLLERPGQLITREEVRERLWEADTFVDFDQGLNTAVKKLRQALNDSAGKPRYIETQPRRGYRFVAPVEAVIPEVEVAPISPGVLPPDDPEAGSPLPTRAARLSKWWGLAAVLILVAASSILYFAHSWGESPAGIESIAVLPLTNLSADASQEYLVDGLTDALITGLARIGTLRVISRTSVMQYKGTHKQIPEIARELHVDAVLEGTVLRSANRVRIATKLIHAATDRTLLATTYEGDLGDILALQNDVSSAIARKVATSVTTTARREPSAAAPSNAEAYEAYLKGRFFWDKRSLAGLTKAIQYFQESIAKDPRSALAYAGLANCFNMLPFYGGSPPRVAFPKAKEAAMKALELDNHLAEGHAALAFTRLHHDWDWAGAESEFRSAIALDPNYPEVRHWFSHYLLVRGRAGDALVEARKALGLDPLSLSINTHLGHHYLYTRNYDKAIAQLRQTLEMYPTAMQTHFWLGRAYEAKGQYEDAIREFQEAVGLSPDAVQNRAALGHVYALAGQTRTALAVVRELEAASRKRYVSAYSLAVVYAGLKDRERTIDYLRRACDERAEGVLYLKIDPYFDLMRSDAKFEDLIRGVGLEM